MGFRVLGFCSFGFWVKRLFSGHMKGSKEGNPNGGRDLVHEGCRYSETTDAYGSSYSRGASVAVAVVAFLPLLLVAFSSMTKLMSAGHSCNS